MRRPRRGWETPTRPIPCWTQTRFTCRHWASLHWWAWMGLDWDDYLWVEYGQIGETGP